MRFRRLNLLAFGHFNGEELEFGDEAPGFHLVYGDNEAGKSTALRAIRGFLYGIPQQTSDTFLHDGPDLRLAAELRFDDGRELSAIRRKGRKNTLLAPDGSPMAEEELSARICDANLFDAMFGLDHETLRHGAQDLLDGKAGESLFGVGMGAHSVRKLYTELQGHADALFRSKGRTLPINQQIDAVLAARRSVSSSATSAAAYTEKLSRLSDLKRERAEWSERRSRLRHERNSLERQLRVLPLLARRAQLQQQWQELGSVPELPADAAQRRTQALRARDEAAVQREHEGVEIERVTRRLQSLELNPGLLSIEATTLEELNAGLGQHKKAQLDLPKRHAEVRALRQDVERELRALGREDALGDLERVRLSQIEEGRLQRLCREKTQFETQLRDTAGKLKRAGGAVTQRERELSRLPGGKDTRALRAALSRAQGQLGSEQRLHVAARRLQRLEQRSSHGLAALEGYSGTATELLALPVPSLDEVASFEARWLEAERRVVSCRDEAARAQREAIELERQRGELEAGAELPTRAGLLELRAERDQELCELGQAPERGISAVAGLIERCDDVSDRMFTEAARVSKLGQIGAALEANAALQAQLRQELEAQERAQVALEADWRGLWQRCQVEPEPPQQMRGWLQRRDEVLALLEERDAAQDECRTLERHLAEVTGQLSDQLAAVGEQPQQLWERQLSALIDRAQATLDELQRQGDQRADMERRLQLETRQLEELQEEQDVLRAREKHWRGDWNKALKTLRLDKDAGPDEVNAVLARLGELFRKQDDVQALERRIAGMERDSQHFASEVNKYVRACMPELEGAPVQEAAQQLIVQARRARAHQDEHERLTQDLEQRSARCERAKAAQKSASAVLDELMAQAGAADLAELSAVEERCAQARRLKEMVLQLEDEIVGQGEGASLEQLVTQTRGATAEGARERIEAIEPELSNCEQRLEAAGVEIATTEQELSGMQNGAALASEELQAATAALRHSVRGYVKYRLGALLLQQEVERYRDRHQGPVLSRAGELFPRLTLGAYSGLRAGFDKKDEQILLCVRKDGREVTVDGLSDGTRDQLYLALRLASLGRYLDTRQSMPLVLDDVLVHFDDQRAAASLEVLGDIAQRVQVLFFSHHQRIVELAERAVPKGVLHKHRLGDNTTIKVA